MGAMIAVGSSYYGGKPASAGHIRLFRYDESSAKWLQLGRNLTGESQGDLFGYAVAMSADARFVAGGGPHNNNGNGERAGNVRVFVRSP